MGPNPITSVGSHKLPPDNHFTNCTQSYIVEFVNIDSNNDDSLHEGFTPLPEAA